MARSLVRVELANGEVALVVPWRDLSLQPWHVLLRPLADLLADAGGTWTATPLADDVSDKTALTGHV